MSYNDESDPQRAHQQPGAEPTEAYQATAEWDAASEEAWDESADDGVWNEPERPVWERDDDQDGWDASAEEDWDQAPEGAAGGVAGAKQSISVAAERITRWFAGLDRRPEYEDQIRDADPIADPAGDPVGDPIADPVAEVMPASAHGAPGFPARERGASPARRAAASRAIAANRRRSVAAGREGAPSGGAFSRGSAHAARALRGDRDRGQPALPPADDQIDEPVPELMGGDGSSRFPVAPLGYNRQAVDHQFAELESEVTQLREALAQASHGEAPMSIQEELERIGEETASILVVAHDKAHETTRLAQEQAERCISDAAANAVAITEEATRRLQELEAETDGIRRRRERLIADVRNISGSLQSLADEAGRRFGDEQPSPVEPQVEAPAEAETAMHAPASAG
jgi:cell division septum initiation protein DivIVA